ncbi:hypothetical protein [Rathayibacter soli]|uniref:hypothetical protein n=1 Tax=Rathayibacter soli TaxID=3144168 RepID=UPI0027E3D13A|nr:hypothetical protein [Glaciibacter superstes]
MPDPNLILNSYLPPVRLSTEISSSGAAASAASPSAAGAIVGAIVVFLVLAAGVTTLIIWWRMRRREKSRIAAMSPAEREQHDAVVEYRAGLVLAQKELDAESRSRATRLKAAEKVLADAHTLGSAAVAQYRGRDGSARVTQSDIQVPQGAFPLTAAVNATVDTAGNLATSSRSTLTRIAAGGILFGPVGVIVGGVAKKTNMHDTRELYLLIASDSFATLITCNPDDGQRVRQFAVAVRQAALHADQMRALRSQAVAHAERALAWEQQNTTPVDAARARLHQASANTSRVDAATRALEA